MEKQQEGKTLAWVHPSSRQRALRAFISRQTVSTARALCSPEAQLLLQCQQSNDLANAGLGAPARELSRGAVSPEGTGRAAAAVPAVLPPSPRPALAARTAKPSPSVGSGSLSGGRLHDPESMGSLHSRSEAPCASVWKHRRHPLPPCRQLLSALLPYVWP